ncbi:Hypothetical predicted protein [Cloeon dipterum]|uniref:Uncharacterized protein n=1 Tax=Cloeon dipterum TaxID=197152 RepID=A0A8S1DYU3_9INSE|nr:Hypothetical predicted protein [Cloeon dipterum]
MAYFQRVNNVQDLHHYITLPPELTVDHLVFVPARFLHNGRYLIGHLDYFSHIGYFLQKNEAQEYVVVIVENFGFDILVGIDNLEWKSHQLGTELDFSDAFVADPLALEDDLLCYGRCFINDKFFPGVIFTNGDCRIFINEPLSRHKHIEFQILVHTEPKYKAEE